MYRIHAKEPILPPELEREIFELAAVMPNHSGEQYSWDMALNISQVCRRAQSWMEPLVYERIALLQAEDGAEDSTAQLLLRTIDSRPASFFAEHVKSLYFDKTIQSSTIQRVLRVCTGVVCLGCHQPYSSLTPFLAPLPLKRLLVSELDFPADLPTWAPSLTHLGLSKHIPDDPLAIFGALSALTHLAIDFSALPIVDSMRYLYQSTSSTIARLLLASPSLRCFVLGTRSRPNYKWIGKHLREKGFSDRRLYVAPMLVECGWCWPYGVRNLFAEAEVCLKTEDGAAE